jgi:hypothetical protein
MYKKIYKLAHELKNKLFRCNSYFNVGKFFLIFHFMILKFFTIKYIKETHKFILQKYTIKNEIFASFADQ